MAKLQNTQINTGVRGADDQGGPRHRVLYGHVVPALPHHLARLRLAQVRAGLGRLCAMPAVRVYLYVQFDPTNRRHYHPRSTKHPGVAFVKVDVDANEEAASKANIRTIPAFYFYRQGKVVGKLVGADQAKLKEQIEDLEATP